MHLPGKFAVIIFILLFQVTANAVLITQSFGAQITNICARTSPSNCPSQPDAFPPFSLESEWNLSLTYETNNMSSGPPGSYVGAVTDISLEIEGLVFGGPVSINEIIVQNYIEGQPGSSDTIRFTAGLGDVDDFMNIVFRFGLGRFPGDPGGPLDDQSLPEFSLLPWDFSYQTMSMTFDYNGTSGNIIESFTLVSAPGSFALLGIGFAVMGLGRRRVLSCMDPPPFAS